MAYYLGKEGIGSTIVERDGVAAHASGYSAGGLNPLEGTGIPGPLGPLAITSFRMHKEIWSELAERSRIDFGPKVVSSIRVAFDESDVAELETSFDVFDSADDSFSAGWLSSDELRELEPRISQDALCALETSGNAALDSHRYTQALARTAETLGAEFRSGTVTGIEADGGRVTSVLTEKAGRYPAERLCSRRDHGRVRSASGLESIFPLSRTRGRFSGCGRAGVRRTGTFRERECRCTAGSLTRSGSARRRRRGDSTRVLLLAAKSALMSAALKLMPAMRDAELVRHTACLRPLTPDWLPIVGKPPGCDNAHLATGAGKKGILLSTGIGKAVADMVVHGRTDLPVDGFEPSRFAGVGPRDRLDQ